MLTSMEEENPKRRLNDGASDEHSESKRYKVGGNSDTLSYDVPCKIINSIPAGTIVNRREFRYAGPYILGPKLGFSAVESISQYLAKKKNTDEFVQIKILQLLGTDCNDKTAEMNEGQAKLLLYTELSLLSMLQTEEGVIKHRGMFSDIAYEEDRGVNSIPIPRYTGKLKKRLVFILDCVTPHEYSEKSNIFINLQQYVAKEKRLPQMNALGIFYEIMSVVERLHKRNIIHRDLKLGNIVLNKNTNKIIITNFCLGKYLLNENDLLYDQRGSPAYISPDVLSGPHKGKPSDIWALGVVLFMMLFGRFPFYEATPAALFRKIRAADYSIPTDVVTSTATKMLIQGLLVVKPENRLTGEDYEIYCKNQPKPGQSTEVRERVGNIIFGQRQIRSFDQFVPTLPEDEDNNHKAKKSVHYDSKSEQEVPRINYRNSICNLTKNCTVNIKPISDLLPFQNDSGPAASTRAFQPMVLTITPISDTSPFEPTILPRAFVRFRDNNGPNEPAVAQIPYPQSRSHIDTISRYPNDAISANFASAVARINNIPTQRSNLDPERDSSIHLRAITSDTVQPILGLFYRMFCMSDEEPRTPSNINLDQPSQLVPNDGLINHPSTISKMWVERVLHSVHNALIYGRVPQAREPFIEFNGTITEDLAAKISLWLRTNCSEHRVIQRVFTNSGNDINEVYDYLTRCGVEVYNVDGLFKIKRHQSFELLLVVAYLLQATGYTHQFFFS
ncbi:Serine/threonine-protein kinase 40 [Pseudolycoriella hygida]|uniref:Serine/threonine-protein kinase 40 n=1 Tax=Pseudolycoriella hygida TaxID=35572 RepID=A0A9Q0S6K2_9DIPT|nr:Serine/threonine-protein kinase 40 [Pseudolycoriella hygida]